MESTPKKGGFMPRRLVRSSTPSSYAYRLVRRPRPSTLELEKIWEEAQLREQGELLIDPETSRANLDQLLKRD